MRSPRRSAPAGWEEAYKQGTDTRLDRTVPIKVLPEDVAADPELKQRFEQDGLDLSKVQHRQQRRPQGRRSQAPRGADRCRGLGRAIEK